MHNPYRDEFSDLDDEALDLRLDESLDDEPRLEFAPHRANAVGVMILCGIGFPLAALVSWMVQPWLSIVIGLAAPIGFVGGWRGVRAPNPRLILSEEGIEDRRWRFGCLWWEELES